MGKEAKIGLSVILVLLIVFGVVLYTRMSGRTQDPAATAEQTPPGPEAQKLDLGKPKPLELAMPDNVPTIVAAKSSPDKLPKGPKVGDLDDWKVVGDKHDSAKKPDGKETSPPSFMPKPPASPADAATQSAPALAAAGGRYPNLTQTSPGLADPMQAPTPAPQAAGPFTQNILTNSVRNTDPQGGNPYANQGQPNPLRGQQGEPPTPGGPYAYDNGPSRYPSGGSGQYQQPGYNNSSYRTYRTPAEPVSRENPYRAGSPYGAGPHGTGSYVVQPADSYWIISERLYGSGAYYKALAEHNRKRNPDADQLRPGQKILAPTVAELEKNYRDLCPKPEHREVAEKRTSMVSTVSHMSGGRVYTVQEGDTLFDIAKYELGKAGRWAEIFQLNRDALGDQYDYLTPGMQLVLPTDQPVGRPSEPLAQRPGSVLR